ncbi:MAG: exodeoxyribonuclease III [Acidimicrobiales bacterium]|nr:exodeoxyribonuclease III [Acidimicrobiales bacterium]
MRIATWNINSLKARMERVEAWLADVAPDVVCLQETKLADAAFPALSFQALGYESAHHGEGRWNGVAILSRVGLTDVETGFGPDDPDPEARLIWATCGGIRVASAYVPNGRALDHDHYRYKLDWLANLRAQLDQGYDPTEPVVVAGDFNIAPTDEDVWDASKFVDATHTSPPEREALAKIVDWGLVDMFRQVRPEPSLFSWWDYRAGRFHKHEGMRIDLLLGSDPVAERVRFATIDRNARKGQQPSDHAPVIVDLAD